MMFGDYFNALLHWFISNKFDAYNDQSLFFSTETFMLILWGFLLLRGKKCDVVNSVQFAENFNYHEYKWL